MKVPPYYYHLKCNTSTVDVTSVCFHLVNSQSPLFGFEKSSPLFWHFINRTAYLPRGLNTSIHLLYSKELHELEVPILVLFMRWELWAVWPDWSIYCTSCKFSEPLAAIIMPKLFTFLGNFCKGVKIFHFASEIIFGQLW